MQTRIRPATGFDGPMFSHDEILTMKLELRRHFGAREVDDLPMFDLWELYCEAVEALTGGKE